MSIKNDGHYFCRAGGNRPDGLNEPVTFKGKNSPEGFCFAERNIPEAVWFGKNNILIIIRNQMDVGTWKGKYIIYDNAKKSGERAYSSDNLPSKDGYIIFALNK
ncbi:hypothetical protein [Escherichia coli]|uniref:hypothetical protein n=1 Tax=Escherichia coli TaxID=562 RepID=UPI003D9C51E7